MVPLKPTGLCASLRPQPVGPRAYQKYKSRIQPFRLLRGTLTIFLNLKRILHERICDCKRNLSLPPRRLKSLTRIVLLAMAA